MMGVGSDSSSSSVAVVAEKLWWQSVDWSRGWGWATVVALLFIVAWHYTRRFLFVLSFRRLSGSYANSPLSQPSNAQFRCPGLSCFLKLISFGDSLT